MQTTTCAACHKNPRKARGQASAYRYCTECIEAKGGVNAVRTEEAERRMARLAAGYALEAAREAALDRAF